MNIIFIEPAFPYYQREFVRGLASVGTRVIGIGERPISHLDGELKQWLADYEQVPSVVDEQALDADMVRGGERLDRRVVGRIGHRDADDVAAAPHGQHAHPHARRPRHRQRRRLRE